MSCEEVLQKLDTLVDNITVSLKSSYTCTLDKECEWTLCCEARKCRHKWCKKNRAPLDMDKMRSLQKFVVGISSIVPMNWDAVKSMYDQGIRRTPDKIRVIQPIAMTGNQKKLYAGVFGMIHMSKSTSSARDIVTTPEFKRLQWMAEHPDVRAHKVAA